MHQIGTDWCIQINDQEANLQNPRSKNEDLAWMNEETPDVARSLRLNKNLVKTGFSVFNPANLETCQSAATNDANVVFGVCRYNARGLVLIIIFYEPFVNCRRAMFSNRRARLWKHARSGSRSGRISSRH